MASGMKQGKENRDQRSGVRGQGTEKRESRNRGSKGKQTPERAGTAEAAKAKRKWRGNGAARLKKAADQVVAENSEELANLLLQDALKGKMESARLLVALSEKTERPKRKRRGRSVADILAAEPEWDGEREERHGGLTAADLKGSEEDWESDSAQAMERRAG
jgi:hypothetical protein